MDILSAGATNLLTPMMLCFALGFGAALARSDLEIPEALGRGLAIYLMLAIGFKGGHALATGGAGWAMVAGLAAALLLSFLTPFLAYLFLRLSTSLDRVQSAATAAHYGSISVVTFVTAAQFLESQAVPYEGYLVAMMAVMETPAIVSGLFLARQTLASRTDTEGGQGGISPELLREIFLNGSVVLLVGGFLIGWATGDRGMTMIHPFVKEMFNGALCLFLLDMGLLAARQLRGVSDLRMPVFLFGLYMPPIGGAIGLAVAAVLGLSLGGATLLAVLAASASYIAVPAAMRLALPEANPAIYVTVSLAVTFPFNVVVGIPVYFGLAEVLGFV